MAEFATLLLEAYAAGTNPWITRLVETRSIFVSPRGETYVRRVGLGTAVAAC